MDQNAALLNDLYQSALMGVSSIEQVQKATTDAPFQTHLSRQMQGYQDLVEKARSRMEQTGVSKKEPNPMTKMTANVMVNLKALKDHSTPNLAEMMITGSTMGFISAIRGQKANAGAQQESLSLMREMQTMEERNVQELKRFL